jgi:hypothetical protein
MRNLWLTAILCLAFESTSFPQTIKSSADDPVRILGISPKGQEFPNRFEVEIYNQSAKGIIAYAIATRGNGPLTGRAAELKGPRPGVDVIPDSARWTADLNVTPDDPKGSEIYVDYVKFDDGTTWGPNNSHYAEWVDGFLMGYRSGKAGLRSLLKRDGVEALLAEIQRK